MKFIFLYVTFANKAEAHKISYHLLQKKLIACANMFPINSIYWWDGKIKQSTEVAAILKTTERMVSVAKREIERIHTYKTPCIIQIPALPNQKYEKWLLEQLSP